jgi:predicted nucleic acid-binding protein
MKLLIDTNVLLDVIQQRKPHDAFAQRLLSLFERGEVTGYVSAISFNNIFYILRKQIGATEARNALRSLRSIFKVVALDERIIDVALTHEVADFEDAIQAECARAVDASCVVTRNTQDFVRLNMSTMSAEQVLAIILD